MLHSDRPSPAAPRSGGHIRALCETAILVAAALVVNMLRLDIMPYGGSLDLILVPLVILALRWGPGWGVAAGFVFGVIKCLIGGGVAYGWQSMILDYFVAYSVIGVAGLFRGRGLPAVATLAAGLCQFFIFVCSGAIIWGIYMPEEFLNLPMSNPWVYSTLYNAVYMLPNIALCGLVMALLTKPLGRYLRGDDLRPITDMG